MKERARQVSPIKAVESMRNMGGGGEGVGGRHFLRPSINLYHNFPMCPL